MINLCQPFLPLNTLTFIKILKGGLFMNRRSRILAALLSLVLFVFCLTGFASAEVLPQTSPPALETISTESESIIVNINPSATSSLIQQWTCGIIDNNDGTVTITGSTNTTKVVDYLDAKVYLQRFNGSTWVDIASRTYSKTSSSYVNDYSSISVAAGYYYRTRSIHTAKYSGTTESETSVSNAIFVE
jgi:hypothetical protein